MNMFCFQGSHPPSNQWNLMIGLSHSESSEHSSAVDPHDFSSGSVTGKKLISKSIFRWTTLVSPLSSSTLYMCFRVTIHDGIHRRFPSICQLPFTSLSFVGNQHSVSTVQMYPSYFAVIHLGLFVLFLYSMFLSNFSCFMKMRHQCCSIATIVNCRRISQNLFKHYVHG